MAQTNVYQNFLESLYTENLRAAWALEGMKFSLMAQTGLDEGDALEVVSKIAAADCQADMQPAYKATSNRNTSQANGKDYANNL